MKKIFYVLAVIAVSVSFAVMQVTVGNADDESIILETQCGSSEIPYYTGILNPPEDTYDVYVRLGKVGQTASVNAYVAFGEDTANCRDIGAVEASGNEWRKLGSYSDIGGDSETTLQLSSVVLADLPDANRPSLMLVSQKNPVCVPTTECITTIEGQKAYIRPAGTSLDQSALHVVRVDTVDLSSVTKVQYFVDNKMLYETATLQDFRADDIPFYANKLIRVIHFTSGQTAVIEANAPDVNHDNLWSTIMRYAKKYNNTVVTVLWLVGIIIAMRVTMAIVTYVGRRRQWEINHGFLKEEADSATTPEEIKRLNRRNALRTVYRYTEQGIVALACVGLFVFISNAFFFQVGTVSGESMYSTLNDGQKILINKTPVTFARLNNTQYVPKRGEIVVASPNFGSIDASIKQDDESLIIKRVCGLPGDQIVVDGHFMKVYNKEYPAGINPDSSVEWSANIQREESLDQIDVTLDENEVFLCGDNRPVSIDSRYNGPISTNQIIGIVTFY